MEHSNGTLTLRIDLLEEAIGEQDDKIEELEDAQETCPCCYERYDRSEHQGKVFNCEHLCCLKCYIDLVMANEEFQVTNCPLCREPITSVHNVRFRNTA